MAVKKPVSNAQQPSTPAAPPPKILRIGVIQAGKIVEERLIRQRGNVTIGASPSCTIVVPASTLPKSFALFEMHEGRYQLVLTDTMDGRVSVDTRVLSLDQVRSEGHAKAGPKGGVLKLALTEASRGKVLLGEVTLLFQFVAPPPIQPRPQLPPSVRGGLIGQMDWVLTSSFGGTTVAVVAFMLVLHGLDFPKNVSPDVIPENFAQYLPAIEKPKPPEKKLDVTKLAKEGEKKVKKAQPVRRKAPSSGRPRSSGKKGPVKTCDDACKAARAAARRARLAAQVSKMGALAIIGVKGKGAGTTNDLLQSGDPGTSADKAFKGVGGVTTSGRGRGGLAGKGGGGSGKSVGIGDLGGRVGGPGAVGTGGKVIERVPTAVVKAAGKTQIEGTLKASAVARILRRGMAGLKGCYQRALKRNPKLSGKISVLLTINATGKVIKVEIDQDTVGDGAVNACIKSYARRWRFPAPEDGDKVEVSFAVGFQSSGG